jgi:hypothetical protein
MFEYPRSSGLLSQNEAPSGAASRSPLRTRLPLRYTNSVQICIHSIRRYFPTWSVIVQKNNVLLTLLLRCKNNKKKKEKKGSVGTSVFSRLP